jgi:hypothetical protein
MFELQVKSDDNKYFIHSRREREGGLCQKINYLVSVIKSFADIVESSSRKELRKKREIY